MEHRAPSVTIKELDAQARRSLRSFSSDNESAAARDAVNLLRQSLRDARIYAVEYELSETREEQLANAKKAKKCLSKAGQAVLTASQHDIFSAVDVAHLSAAIEQARGDLK